jgi:hypothetical protein
VNRGEVVDHVTGKGKTIQGVWRPDFSEAQAKKIDPFAFNAKGKGWFIRAKHFEKLPPMGESAKTIAGVAVPTPPPKPGFVRFYHGGSPESVTGKLWFTSDLRDAHGWASRDPQMRVWFVDVKKGAEGVDWGDAANGMPMRSRHELPAELASGRKPLVEAPSSETAVAPEAAPAPAPAPAPEPAPAPAPVAAPVAPPAVDRRAAKARARMSLDPERDSLLVAMAKLGGLRREVAQKEWGLKPEELKHHVPVGGLKGFPFRASGGVGLDDMLTRLREVGFFAGVADDEVARHFEDAVSDELGGSPHYTVVGQMRQAQQGAEDRARDEAEEQALLNPPALTQEEADRLHALSEQYGVTDDEIADWRAIQDDIERAHHAEQADAENRDEEGRTVAAREDGRDDAQGSAGVRPAGGEEARVRVPAGEGLLSTQSADDLRAKTEREAAAKKSDAAEQQRLENKAKADAERGEFALTGSDRAADVGAAHGQTDLLSAPAADTATAPSATQGAERPDQLIELRKRHSVLESLRKCLA